MRLYAVAMSASYVEGNEVYIETLAGSVWARSQDEAVGAGYRRVAQDYPLSDGWENYSVAASEIPEEARLMPEIKLEEDYEDYAQGYAMGLGYDP